MKPSSSLPCEFSGFQLDFNKDNGAIQQNQRHYLRRLQQLDDDASFSNFRSMRMRLAWLSHTRPDFCYQISALVQIIESTYKITPKTFITQINRASNYTRLHTVAITFHQLDKATIKILGYADASFSNNLDLSSQLGFIILLSDKMHKVIQSSSNITSPKYFVDRPWLQK